MDDASYNACAPASATAWSCSPDPPLTPMAPTTFPSLLSGNATGKNHDASIVGRMDAEELPAGLRMLAKSFVAMSKARDV